MKSFFAVLALTVFINQPAKAMDPISSGMLVSVGLVTTGGLVSGSDFPCIHGGGDGCPAASATTIASPIAAILVSVFGGGFMKEELPQLKNDSIEFLAGLDKTYLLEEVLDTLRQESQELAKLSDEELAIHLSSIIL